METWSRGQGGGYVVVHSVHYKVAANVGIDKKLIAGLDRPDRPRVYLVHLINILRHIRRLFPLSAHSQLQYSC